MYTGKGLNGSTRGWLLAVALLACNAAGGQEASSDDYVIGPGDTLNIFVWREPDFSATLPVRPDGRISTPLVEDMPAVGKTPSQLARDVEQVLSEFVRNPQVTVMVEDFVGTFKSQVRVLGQVASPGSYPYRDGMTLLDALTEAGGLTEFAAGRRGLVRRTVEGKQEEVRVRIDRLMQEGDLEQNRSLLPGDVIVVPEAVF